MEPKRTRDRPDKKDLDLSQKWLRHLREASTKTSPTTFPCHYCAGHDVHASEEALLNHVLHAHPEKAPPREDSAAFERFKENLRLQVTAPSKARYALSLSLLPPSAHTPRHKKPSSRGSGSVCNLLTPDPDQAVRIRPQNHTRTSVGWRQTHCSLPELLWILVASPCQIQPP